ncbi:hypothetical protein Bbelb_247130 [Branchiostoma belcheri]|nr:hypothetical protein Bbelb_247130 [Branchiostoma belcheri]
MAGDLKVKHTKCADCVVKRPPEYAALHIRSRYTSSGKNLALRIEEPINVIQTDIVIRKVAKPGKIGCFKSDGTSVSKARFWIRVDYPEPYLDMALDKARFWIQQ